MKGRSAQANVAAGPPPTEPAPSDTLRLEYEVTFSPELANTRDDGKRERVRPYVDCYFVWRGRPYHTDAWLPRVAVRSVDAE